MNKLQKEVLNDYNFSGIAYTFSESIDKIDSEHLVTQFTWYDLEDGPIKTRSITRQKTFDNLKINYPADKKEFTLFIHARSLDYVEYKLNEKTIKVKASKLEYRKVNVGYVVIKLTVDEKVDSLVLNFLFDVVEKYTLNITYDEFVEVVVEEEKSDDDKVKIYSRTGDSLINVYFKRVSSNVVRTHLVLYLNKEYPIEYYEILDQPHSKDKLQSIFRIEGLAYGDYLYKIIQLGARNEILYESDHRKVTLRRPDINIQQSGKRTIRPI